MSVRVGGRHSEQEGSAKSSLESTVSRSHELAGTEVGRGPQLSRHHDTGPRGPTTVSPVRGTQAYAH